VFTVGPFFFTFLSDFRQFLVWGSALLDGTCSYMSKWKGGKRNRMKNDGNTEKERETFKKETKKESKMATVNNPNV
jgi:hypothetical protein